MRIWIYTQVCELGLLPIECTLHLLHFATGMG